MSPGAKAGRMLPDSTVTGRYQPVRGTRPSMTSAVTASRNASCAASTGRRRSADRSAGLPALLWLEIPAGIRRRLLAGGRALRAEEAVRDRRRLVLQRVAGAARQRQRHAQMVGRAVR